MEGSKLILDLDFTDRSRRISLGEPGYPVANSGSDRAVQVAAILILSSYSQSMILL